MHSVLAIIKRVGISSAVLVLSSVNVLPLASTAFATCDPTPPPDSTYGAGIHHPTGSDAATYTYNCDTQTWTNAYYTYYPATNTRVANFDPDYSYDCASGKWTMLVYNYSPADGNFYPGRVATSDPGLPTNCPPPATPTPTNPASGDPSGSTSPASSSATVAGTGPGSTNATGNTVNLNGNTTNNNTLVMNNGVTSNATSGNALVLNNTTGGNATSGNAASIANIANLLQSSSNAFGPGTALFTANINGDVNGDFMFDPSALITNTGPGSTNSTGNNLTVNTNNTNNTNAQINNTVDVGATSGNATVANNTTGGDATSGNADAIVNLMNLINSTVASGHSFIGTVNINGNLNGDILLPQNFINQLLASTGPNSTNTSTTNLTDNSTTTNNTTEGINNAITSTAQSGNASVAGNTTGGSAKTGSAGTNTTIMNLAGGNVIGQNDLLVFVNVLGHWVGMIVNAPAGSTAASLGGGITGAGPGSTNSTGTTITDNSTTTNNTTLGINNVVNAHAQSGNATVADNTTGGNATSGDAHTAVNVLNMEGSNLSLSNWFGVLFINVFGNWTGSFGVNTSAGDPVSSGSTSQVAAGAAANPAAAPVVHRFVSFVGHTNSGGNFGVLPAQAVTTASVLGSSTSVAKKVASAALPTPDNATHASYLLPAIGVSIAVLMLLGERLPSLWKKHKS